MVSVSVELSLPDTWQRRPPPEDVSVCLERPSSSSDAGCKLTVTVRPGLPGSTDVELMARALDGFRLIDQGSVDSAYGMTGWLVAYYRAQGRAAVTMHSWQWSFVGHAVRMVATIPCRDYDEVADELNFAAETIKLGAG